MIDFSAFGDTLVAAYAILFVIVVSAFGFISHTSKMQPPRYAEEQAMTRQTINNIQLQETTQLRKVARQKSEVQ